MPIVEPEILLDGDHPIERTLEVAERVWAEVFYYLAENNVMFEGILLKPSMVTPGSDHKEKASPETIAKYTLTMLRRRVPPAVPGIMVQNFIIFLMALNLNFELLPPITLRCGCVFLLRVSEIESWESYSFLVSLVVLVNFYVSVLMVTLVISKKCVYKNALSIFIFSR